MLHEGLHQDMSDQIPKWSGSPEWRIIRELRETRLGGLKPGRDQQEFGRVIETLVIRELQMLCRQQSNTELRFARGFVVDDYGSIDRADVHLPEDESISKAGPRFDIVCYYGNVAWADYAGFPFALVPKSFAIGVLEVKRTVTPKKFTADSGDHINKQLRKQRNYLSELGIDFLQIVVGANYYGTKEENQRKSIADYVALLGDLNQMPSATKMAQNGELAHVIDILSGEKPANPKAEKTENLQDIAKKVANQKETDRE